MIPDRIESHVDMIDVTCLPHAVPDPAWVFRDAKGHVHGYIDGELPTLKAKVITRYDEDGDEWEETRYCCRRCKKRVRPGTKMVDEGRKFIPGLRHITAYVRTDSPLYELGKDYPVEVLDHDAEGEYRGVVVDCKVTSLGYEYAFTCRPKVKAN